MTTKICSNLNCDYNGKPQPINNFYLRNNNYRSECKNCTKKRNTKYYSKNKNNIIDQHKNYIEKNKDKLNKYYKEYKNKYASYEKYYNRLSFCEDIQNKFGILEVKCAYCNKWFAPLIKEVQNRIIAISNNDRGEQRFYCSSSCKNDCPIYGQILHDKSHKKKDYSNELNSEFRKYIFNLDNYECQRCGESKLSNNKLSLHCHHINPKKISPIEESDPDNGITLCKDCHKWVHSFKGCRYNDLAKCNI